MNNQVSAEKALPHLGFSLSDVGTETTRWIETNLVQALIGIGVATLIVFVLLGIRAMGLRLCRRDTSGTHWSTTIGRALGKTRLWFMIPLAAEMVDGYAGTPEWLSSTIQFVFIVTATLQVAIWVRELILGAVAHRAGTDVEHSSLGSAMGIIRLLVTVAIFAIAIVIILDNLGVNVTGLVAGLGIGGIAIGLAAQGIFSDLFAALSILFDKPFKRGETIKFDQTTGTVEAIGLKTTRVRSTTGEEVVVSNANLLNKELRNMTQLDHRRMTHMLGVIYQTPVATLEAIPEMVRAIVEGQDKAHFVHCGIKAFGASSIDFELQFDIQDSVFAVAFETNHKVLVAVLRAFNDAGIEFAYPTQTSFTAAPDGKAVMPYPEWNPVERPDKDG